MTEKDQKLLIEDRKVFIRNFTITNYEYMLLKDEQDRLLKEANDRNDKLDDVVKLVYSDKFDRLPKAVKKELVVVLNSLYIHI